MSGQTSFEERLKRLESKSGGGAQMAQPAPAMGGGGGGMNGGTPHRGGNGGGQSNNGGMIKMMLALAVVFCLAMAGLFYYTVQQTTGLASQAAERAAAAIQGTPFEPQEPGIIQSLVNRLSGPDVTPDTPIEFLPNPGQGWVRVTQADAKAPDINDRINAQWPSDKISLADHSGFRHLDFFLKIYRYDDIEERVQSKTRTRAMYMHPDGGFISVRLQFLTERRVLGAADDASGWISALANREMQDLDTGETLEIVEFAGIESTNRTKPAGQNLFSRPIGNQRDVPNGIAVAVPLSHRVVMRFDGLVEPRWVDQFLAATDIEALRAHFD